MMSMGRSTLIEHIYELMGAGAPCTCIRYLISDTQSLCLGVHVHVYVL